MIFRDYRRQCLWIINPLVPTFVFEEFTFALFIPSSYDELIAKSSLLYMATNAMHFSFYIQQIPTDLNSMWFKISSRHEHKP